MFRQKLHVVSCEGKTFKLNYMGRLSTKGFSNIHNGRYTISEVCYHRPEVGKPFFAIVPKLDRMDKFIGFAFIRTPDPVLRITREKQRPTLIETETQSFYIHFSESWEVLQGDSGDFVTLDEQFATGPVFGEE